MKRIVLLGLALIVSVLLLPGSAAAQATRTWVSGVGDDVNPCSRTAPCKTFAGAISKTAAFGEINCLDSGGFGAVTITKSISILCTGVEAGVLSTGTNAILVVNTAATDRVLLRGLDFEGVNTGVNGINFSGGGTLFVENCQIRGFTSNGIIFAPNTGTGKLHVRDNTVIYANATVANTAGVRVAPVSSAAAVVTINGVQLQNNGAGIITDSTNGAVNMTVRDSMVASNNADGIKLTAGVHNGATVDRSTIAFNGGNGILANGAQTVALLGNSLISGNLVAGVATSGGGVLQSFKNNEISGNVADGTPITAFPGPGGQPLQ